MVAIGLASRGLISAAPPIGLATAGLIDTAVGTPTPPPPPPTPPSSTAPAPHRSGGGAGYDPFEYVDGDIVAENAELAAESELADLTTWANLLAAVLADTVTAEVGALETSAVVESTTGDAVGQLDATADATAAAPSLSVEVDVFDVTVGVDDDTDE